jgi:hypothetical protein
MVPRKCRSVAWRLCIWVPNLNVMQVEREQESILPHWHKGEADDGDKQQSTLHSQLGLSAGIAEAVSLSGTSRDLLVVRLERNREKGSRLRCSLEGP